MNSVLTLEDYRLRYPNTATTGTLTQRGLIGGLLERHERRVARRIRRRAMWQLAIEPPIRGLIWLWHVVTASAPAAIVRRA